MTAKAAAQPNLKLSFAISGLIVLGLAWFAWHIYSTYSLLSRIVDYDTKLMQLRGEIIRLDEMAGLLSKLAASSGELEYVQRHEEVAAELDRTIGEAMALAPPELRGKVKLKAYAPKLKLQELDDQSLALVKAGHSEQAHALLASPEYQARKAAHAAGIAAGVKILDDYLLEVSAQPQRERQRALFQVGAVSAVMLMLVVGMILILRGQILTHRKLMDTHTRLAESYDRLDNLYHELQTAQAQLIQSEKMAALGQLIAGIAHEVNTPLGVIRASIGNIADALHDSIRQLPVVFQTLDTDRQAEFFALLDRALSKRQGLSAREERALKRALIAALEERQVAHADELGDTLADLGIYDDFELFLPLLQSESAKLALRAAYDLAIQQENSQNIVLAVERASKVVFALKSYARFDHSGEKFPTNIADSVEVVLTLYHNLLKQGIEVIKNYQPVPVVPCYPDELNQVWTNLVHNAIQAMGGKGTLEVGVFPQDRFVVVSIRDSGKGIAPEIRERIFEPFFTTKPAGEGSGLGLHIVRKIIDKHQGRIEVESEPGKTTFQVYLPMSVDAQSHNEPSKE